MTTPVPAKICANCGCDCSGRQRTKDTLGNYFCKPCFDDLLARKRRGERIAPPGLRKGADLDLSDLALSGSGAAFDPAPFVADAELPLAPPVRLAGEGDDAPAGGASSPAALAGSLRSWPALLGGVGAVTGLAIAGGAIAIVVHALRQPNETLLRWVVLVSAGAAVAGLGGWHVAGGVETLCRRGGGPIRLRASAVHLAFLAVITALATSTMDRGGADLGVGPAVTMGAALVFPGWAAVVVLWTFLPPVRRSIEGWEA